MLLGPKRARAAFLRWIAACQARHVVKIEHVGSAALKHVGADIDRLLIVFDQHFVVVVVVAVSNWHWQHRRRDAYMYVCMSAYDVY